MSHNTDLAYQSGMNLLVNVDRPEPKKTAIRVLADYQLFGDIETDDWTKRALAEPESIKDYHINVVATGLFGLRYIHFTAWLVVPVGDYDEVHHSAREILCEAFGDTDVNIRLVTTD
jgi:hypothetical protein